MSQEDLAERLGAVERRLDAAYPEPTGGATDEETLERVEAFAERLADLEAAVEAVEGYVGEIERVDGELEQRADAAIAAAEGAEERVDAVEQRADGLAERLDALEARSESAPSADDLAALRSEVADLEDRLTDAADGSAPATQDSTRGAESVGPTGPGPGRNDRRRCDCDVPGGAGDLDGTASAGRATDDRSRGGWKSGHRPEDSRSRAVQPGSQEAHAPASGPNGVGSRSDGTRSRPDPGGSSRAGASAASAPSASRPPGDGSQTPPVGRADGGQPGRRGADGGSPGDPTISGWDDPVAPPTSEPPGGSRAADGGGDERSWASARTETLLDRLRSLL